MKNSELSAFIDEWVPSAFEGMTNGEVIQALFPNAVIRNDDSMLIKEVLFTSEMWNAPYKAESEDKE